MTSPAPAAGQSAPHAAPGRAGPPGPPRAVLSPPSPVRDLSASSLAAASAAGAAPAAAAPRGIVFDLQRGAMHDGPGIRTTVFLKGCPLRCAWCHNPESQAFAPETGRSGKTYGREMSVADVMDVVRRDRAFYASSGGGLTLSGGEPTAQFEFCRALLSAARAEGIATCLDTCGHTPWEKLAALVPLVDVFLFDYKATGPDAHRALTGVDGALILANLRRLLAAGARVILRCPLVPGANATPAHDAALAALAAEFPALPIERLPYHRWGEAKYADLGRPAPAFA